MVAGHQSTSTASAPLAPLTPFLCCAGTHNRQQWCVGRVCVCLCQCVSVGGESTVPLLLAVLLLLCDSFGLAAPEEGFRARHEDWAA
jgi:hypothetical protein